MSGETNSEWVMKIRKDPIEKKLLKGIFYGEGKDVSRIHHIEDYWIDRFEVEVLPRLVREFSPESVFIFGSRVQGNAGENSDIDVLLISDLFRDMPFIKRMPLVLRTIRFERHVDYICYTPGEFQKIKNKSSIVMDALETGIKVA